MSRSRRTSCSERTRRLTGQYLASEPPVEGVWGNREVPPRFREEGGSWGKHGFPYEHEPKASVGDSCEERTEAIALGRAQLERKRFGDRGEMLGATRAHDRSRDVRVREHPPERESRQ